MKRLFLVVALVTLALPQAGQAGWWKTYGTDAGERGFCVQITNDENYIIAGYTWVLLKVDALGDTLWSSSYEGIGGKWVEQTSDGGYIVATRNPSLLRVDQQGDSLWSRSYGMYSYCAQECSDNGYIVIGGTNGYAYDEQLILVKTDPEGNAAWTHTYAEPGNNWNVGNFIQRTDDGGYIVFGLTGYIDPEYNEWSKVWLVKIDSEGNKLWSKAYGREEYGYTSKAYCGRQTNDGGYIITGVSSVGLWLLKTDSLGDTLWTKGYNTSTGGTGFSVEQTQDTGYIITGVTETFLASFKVGTAKLWLLKTDSEGDTLWTRLYYGDGYDVGRCVRQCSDKGYVIVGYTSSHGAGESDIYLLRTDSLGLLMIEEKPINDQGKNWVVMSPLGKQVILSYSNCPRGFSASIFDASGRKVDEIHTNNNSGVITWGMGNPVGVYFIVAKDNHNRITTAKVVLLH